jgi:ABC-type proline/glycine betaine transport system permease subunit
LFDPDNWGGRNGIRHAVFQHVWYSVVATVAAIVVAFPIGVAIGHTGRGRFIAANVSGIWRAIPTIGVVGGPIYLSAVAAIVLGITQPGGLWQGIGGAFMFVWELLLALWLIFRGFLPTAPIVASLTAPERAIPAPTAG